MKYASVLLRHVARVFYLVESGSKEEDLLEDALEALAEKENMSGTEAVDEVTRISQPVTVHMMAALVKELLSADPRIEAEVKVSKVRGGKKGYGKNFEVVVLIDVKETA